MNARKYRVSLSLSPFDFPAITGLGQSSVTYFSEPRIHDKNVLLSITMIYILTDMATNMDYEVLSVKSDYKIPILLINLKEDVYDFYKDAAISLNEAYLYFQRQFEPLPDISFPIQPIENYQKEIDRVFNLLSSQN